MVKKYNKKCSTEPEPVNNIDLFDLSQRINKIIKNTVQPEESEEDKLLKDCTQKLFENQEYLEKFQKYITEKFNSKCINLLTTFFHSRKNSFPGSLKTLIKVARYLMMNEYEIAVFALYIKNFNWGDQEKSSLNYYLFLLGCYIKRYCNSEKECKEIKFILYEEDYRQWIKKCVEGKNPHNYNLFDVNEMYQDLNKPLTAGFKKNYIDYNNVVEKIIHLSNKNPEEEKFNQKRVKETQILDNIKESNFQNDKIFIQQNSSITNQCNPIVSNNMNQNFLQNPGNTLQLPDERDLSGIGISKKLQSLLSISSKNDESDGKYLNEYGPMIGQGMSRFDQKMFADRNPYTKKESSFFGQNDINIDRMSFGLSQPLLDYGFSQSINKSKMGYDSNNNNH